MMRCAGRVRRVLDGSAVLKSARLNSSITICRQLEVYHMIFSHRAEAFHESLRVSLPSASRTPSCTSPAMHAASLCALGARVESESVRHGPVRLASGRASVSPQSFAAAAAPSDVEIQTVSAQMRLRANETFSLAPTTLTLCQNETSTK